METRQSEISIPNNNISTKIITIICWFIVLCAIIPLFMIAPYNYPAADDYSFSINTHQAWEKTHSLIPVLQEACEMVKEKYYHWQGTYSAIFLMALQPSLFGVHAYTWVPFIIITSLILSYLWFLKILIMDICNGSRYIYLTVCACLLIPTLLFPVNGVEAFYWYNGSIFYGFYFACSLILLGCILKSSLANHKLIYNIICIFLSLFIGGGNFSTGLTLPLIIITASIFAFIHKKKIPTAAYLSVLFLTIGLCINIIAPGNEIRQANYTDTPNPIIAIIKSIFTGGKNLIHWIKIPELIVFLILSPFVYQTAKKSSFQFKYPLLISIISFGIYCAMYTPPFFAMNNEGPGRLVNIIKYSFFWLLLINLFYYCGYFCRRTTTFCNSIWINKMKVFINKYPVLVYLTITIALGSTLFRSASSTHNAVEILQNGDAKQYGKEMKERYLLYQNSDKEIIVKPLSVKPPLLFITDITNDKNHWINQNIALYFNKEYIISQ